MHKTVEQMNDELAQAWSFFNSKQNWLHYKGGYYAIDSFPFSFNTETSELMVTYYRFDGPNFDLSETMIRYCRPFREWQDTVLNTDGIYVSRFTPIEKTEVWVAKT